ncbi:MAG: hypothetical protein ACFFD2_11100 [Promethearchaeota archaeon]
MKFILLETEDGGAQIYDLEISTTELGLINKLLNWVRNKEYGILEMKRHQNVIQINITDYERITL